MLSHIKQPCRVMFIFSDVNSSPQLIAILEKFQKKKVEFRLILLSKSGTKLCNNLDSLGIAYSLCSISSKYRIPLVFLSILKSIISLNPQAVYASGQFATLVAMPAAFLARVPVRVFTRHHSNFHQYFDMRLGLLVDKISNRYATKIIAVSKIVEKILISVENVPRSKVRIIYNGIALSEFQNRVNNLDATVSSRLNPAETIRIGVIARITELKGIEYSATAFVKFLGEFPNSHLSLVGAKADSFNEVSRILLSVPESNYDFVEFDTDIPKFLDSLDMLVHVPIAADIESFGLVYMEALAFGVPSIFTLSGILSEIPQIEKYAQIVPHRDAEAIYLAMINFANNSMTSLERFPPQLMSQFGIEEMADLYFDEIYSSLSPH